jgi:transposase
MISVFGNQYMSNGRFRWQSRLDYPRMLRRSINERFHVSLIAAPA